MGFFSKKSKQTSRYDNPELRQYTEAYREAAPWGFATLDPTATLFAMGEGTKVGGKDLGQGMKDYLKGLSADEKKQRQGTDDALARIKERQESGQFLTAEETAFINTSLDQAFEYAHKTGYEDWTKATQMMAGSRGMRMSDTPVADPAMRELRNFELGLGSKRAELGLGATMNMSQQQQAFDASFAQFNQMLAQNKWQAQQGFLFGGGLQAAGNLSSKNTATIKAGMSGLEKVTGTMGMVNSGLDLMSKVGSMGAGRGMVGGGTTPGGGGWGGMQGLNFNPYS